jgi:hypothetical protein
MQAIPVDIAKMQQLGQQGRLGPVGLLHIDDDATVGAGIAAADLTGPTTDPAGIEEFAVKGDGKLIVLDAHEKAEAS